MYLKGLNPILPLDEHIPDGEPHMFGACIYLFGSHDTEGDRTIDLEIFCDYAKTAAKEKHAFRAW